MAEQGILNGIISKARLNQKAVVFTVCVFASVIFWVFTSLGRFYETKITIPVSYRNFPFTRQVEGELPKSIELHFKGTGFDLFRTHLRNRPDSIVIDVMASLNKGYQLNLATISLRNQFPGDLKAYKLIPELIAPDLRHKSSKRVPVVLKTQLSFSNRFGSGGNIIVRPDSIDLAGEGPELEKITSVETENIILKDISTNAFGSVYLMKKLPPGITVSNSYVYFYIPVLEYTEGTFEIPVDLPVSQRARVTLLPQKVKVTYMAPLMYFDNIKPSDFKISTEIPLSNYPERLEVRLEKSPSHLGKVKVEPELLDYFIHE